jgi:hypothetical protein
MSGPPVLRDEVVAIGMVDLMLGWRAYMKSVSITSHNHAVKVS